MGCWHDWHDWHGCGPSYGVPYGRGWSEPADWYEEREWPARRRDRRLQRLDPEMAVGELESRLDELRDEMRRVESELTNLRGAGEAAGKP